MSIAVLNEVYTEVRRLAIAGSVVAPGDFRLKKLVEPLKKAGVKAPVFAKVADCVEEVVASDDTTSATKLLNLSSLVCSILFTQGATGLEGKLEPIPVSSVETKRSQISARMLKPLIEALTSTGSGRLEQIRSAVELGLFSDLRLVRPALCALDDVYSEVADLIAEKVLPMYGKAILADLQSSFDIKGRGGHPRRLKLMHSIDPTFAREIAKESLATGSSEVKVAAIECLGDSPDDLTYLIEQSRAKSKEIRQSAYHALCKLNHPQALEVLSKGIDGKDLELVTAAVRGCQPTELCSIALARAIQLLNELQTIKDKKKQGEEVIRWLHLLSIIQAQPSPAAQSFLEECIQSADSLLKVKSSPGGLNIIDSIVRVLAESSPSSVMFLVKHRDSLPGECFETVFNAALRTISPKDLYKTFSPYLDRNAKKDSSEAQRHQVVWDGLQGKSGFHWRWIREDTEQSWDVAWLNDAIAADDLDLVIALAVPKHSATIKYFDTKLNDKKSLGKKSDLWGLTAALIKVAHPLATSFVVENIQAALKKKGGYDVYRWLWLASRLDADAIPLLESLASDAKLSERAGNQLIDTISEIRERTQKQTA